MRLLPTRNIFLDTNIFEENNFFHSNNIQSLFYYSKIGVISLYMTSISKMELIDRMKKGLINAKEEHNKLVGFINKSRILRNLNTYEKFEKSKITVEGSISELSNKLDTIITNSNIKLINANSVNIEEVFRLYYNQEAPFSSGGKKYEFPDAFIVKSIDSWCKQNKKKVIVVTKDLNFGGYKSTHLIFKNDLSKLLSDITTSFDLKQKNQIIPFIDRNLKENESDIIDLIDSEIDPLIRLDVDFEKVTNIHREKVKFKDYRISSIRAKYAEVTYNVEIEISFIIFPTKIDIESSFFDDSLRPKKFSQKKTISCDLEIGLNRKNEIKLKWINTNQKLFINMEEQKNYW